MAGLWTRRAAGLAALGALGGAAVSARAAGDPMSGAALYADVVRYDGFGEHRTGTPGDLAASDWLTREMTAAGYRTETLPFAQPVFELEAAEVRLGGRALEAFPLWTPQAGAAAGPLSLQARPGVIALISFPTGVGAALDVSAVWRKPVQAAIDAGAVGVVAVTENPLGELAAFNVPHDAPAWPVPVLAVAGREGPALAAAAQAGASVQLALTGAMRAGSSGDLIATRPGPGKPLVISTPKSGWFHCAGERGSGVAIWLGLARHLAAQDRNLMFMAASGHEFDGYGGHQFAGHRAPSPAEARGWVHIGANVAAYDFGLEDGRIVRRPTPQAGRRLAVSESLLPAAKAAFAGQPSYERPVDIDVEGAGGEIAEYQRRGYRPLVGMLGLHPLHHTRRDRPDVTGPELLEPVARGLAALIAAL
ncbi:MAG: hypothetical protein E7812_14130 [Phenylobacterium sp.]|nr:MAG: hypothetical protein E7812_14130 [Phenylobacterium sp.]